MFVELTFLISKCLSKTPVVRVSSAKIKSASLKTLRARLVISSKFPTGVGTKYKTPMRPADNLDKNKHKT